MGHFPGEGGGIGDREDSIGLEDDRHRDQRDDQRIGEDDAALETEEQHDRGKQANDRGRFDPCHEGIDRREAALGDQQPARDDARDQWNDDIQADREQQRLPGHGDFRDAEQERDDRREREHHHRIIHAHLRQRIGRIALRQLRPDKDHRGARRGAEQDQAGNIGFGIIGRNEIREDVFEEQDAEQGHRERLDQPVDHQRDDQALGLGEGAAQAGELDADHHRPDHRPDQDRDGEIDIRIFQRGQRAEGGREQLAERETGGQGERDPDGEVFFKEAHARSGLRALVLGGGQQAARAAASCTGAQISGRPPQQSSIR